VEETLNIIGLDSQTWERLLWSLVLLVSAIALNLLVRRVVQRQVEDTARRYSIKKATNYTLGFVVLLVLVLVWTRGGTGVATYLGIVSAGLAIALQDPLINLAGWIFVVVRRPFGVGDRIDIGVTLTLRYLCEPRRRRSTANDIWESILDAFSDAQGVEFAYPTTRYYDNRLEGKP